MKQLISLSLSAFIIFISFHVEANETINQLEKQFQQQGATAFSAENGKMLWTTKHNDPKTGKQRSCTTCHGTDLTKSGLHQRTKKVIEPMAPSVNPARLTKIKKVNKWFLRNCKWTLGRECSAQEKGDILAYLKGL